MKLQLLFGDESVLKVCKLNTNYDIKFHKCSRKKLCLMSIRRCFVINKESW